MSVVQISVIIPCFNVAGYVADAVHSVYESTRGMDAEVICVNNASTDQTATVLGQLSRSYPLKVIDETEPGACAARNAGLRLATGHWVQFLDADDLLLPGKLLHQMSISVANGESSVAGAFTRHTTSGRQVTIIPESDVWRGLFNTRLGITSSLLLVRAHVLEAGGWNTALRSSQEYELMFRLLKLNKKIVPDGQNLTVVRERPSGQISQSDSAGRWQRYLQLRTDVMQFLSANQPHYMAENKAWFHQAFFDLLRTVYVHEPQVALDFYNQFFPRGYRPQRSAVSGSAYLTLHRLFGFPGADRWLRKMKQI